MIKNVILDAGHGGIDKQGNYTTFPNKMHVFQNGETAYEGMLNRGITSHIGSCLKQHPDINLVYTVHPDDPRDLSLSYRVRVANSFDSKNSIFVSVHCNASPNHNASGFEIFTTKGLTNSDYLAENIATAAEFALDKVNLRTRYDLSDGDKDKEVDFYVLRKTKCPSVLVECGFFDFKPDYELLKNPIFQSNLGSFIYTGIINYINSVNNKS